jgi:hypothetical protein
MRRMYPGREGQNLQAPNTGRPNTAIARQLTTSGIQLGSTLAGSYWALRALHPCDEAQGGGAPIPDASNTQSANLESRLDSTIAGPDFVPGSTGNWDCEIACLPFSEIPVAYRKKLSDKAWGSDDTNWVALKPNGANIQPGVITLGNAGAIEPVVKKEPSLYLQSTGFRQTYRGLTICHNSSSLNNQGMVTAGQWENTPSSQDLALTIGLAPTLANQSNVFVLRDIPDDPAQIITRCPQAGQWRATEGIYMPMRFPNPSHQYTIPAGKIVESTGGVVNSVPGAIQMLGTGTNALDSWVFNSADNNNDVVGVAGIVNQNLGIAYFTGLDKTSELVVKVRSGIEMSPRHNTIAASFIQPGPFKDDVAINAVTAISRELPVVYAAKYNLLGSLLPMIGAAAKFILPVIAPWLLEKGVNWITGNK